MIKSLGEALTVRYHATAWRARAARVDLSYGATVTDDVHVFRVHKDESRWLRKPLLTLFVVHRACNRGMVAQHQAGGAEWEQPEYPNWSVRRPFAPN